MRKGLGVVVGIVLIGCGGGSSPTAPGPIPNPSPTTVTISGRVTGTITGEAVSGAVLTFSGRAVTADASGRWTLDGQNPNATLPVEISAPGYVTRHTTIRTDQGRSDVTVDVIRNGGEFSLAFYRQLIRDGHDFPGSIAAEPLRRWTTTPNFYIVSEMLTPGEIAQIEQTIRVAVPQMTGGLFQAGAIESGPAREQRSGFVNVEIFSDPTGPCGTALVGANPGLIRLNRERCGCGTSRIAAPSIAHEVGHAMGARHTDSGIMKSLITLCGSSTFTAAEQYHARVAYHRPVGNMDADRDVNSPALLAQGVGGSAPVVQCFR